MDQALKEKYERLRSIIKETGRLAVAFSSGVDSALLLSCARDVLGEDVLALTAVSPNFPSRESLEAASFCRERGIRQLTADMDLLSLDAFSKNPPDRCYHCKKALFGKFLDIASSEGFPVLAEGSNVDDTGDYRPGLIAISELGVRSPLREAGLTKADIRAISRELSLPTWDKPSYACLASRFVYGESITKEKLSAVEQAESWLLDHGFRQMRVRVHGNLARIEVEKGDLPRIIEPAVAEELHAFLRGLGFDYVTVDLAGFLSGSMNRTIL